MAIRLVARRDLKEIFPKEFANRSLIGKFIDYIMNNFMQPSSEELINGYIGKKTVAMQEGDFYLPEATEERQVYQLNPSVVSIDSDTGETNAVVDYCNFINTLKKQGCDTNDQNRLLSNKYWSWCPPINVDMFINYNYYYWVEEGPTPIELNNPTNANINIIGKKHYTYEMGEEDLEFSNGLRVIFKNDANEEYNNKPFIIEGVGTSIQLVDDSVILEGETTNPDYFIMERGCTDGNSWSKRNRWFHRSIVNNVKDESLKFIQASRPIICFNKDIELYNYGVYNRGFVDILYKGNKSDINGQPAFIKINDSSYYKSLQGIELRDGVYILITGDSDNSVNNIVYQVTGVETIGTIMLQPVLNGLDHVSGKAIPGESITVKSNGSEFAGKYFYFKNINGLGKWVEGQEKTKNNQSPLFNLYDENKTLLDDMVYYSNSSFKGNRLFDYISPEEIGIEDTSKIKDDEFLGKKIITNSYGNYIFNNVLDSENYTYIENNVEVPYKGLKFYKINHISDSNDNGVIDDSKSEYLNTWHIASHNTTQYITTEIVVTDNQEKVEKGEENGIMTYYTKYVLAYKPDEAETQVTSFVYLNGSMLNENIDYIIKTDKIYNSDGEYVKDGETYLLISPNNILKKDDYIYVKLLVSKIEGELEEGYYYDLPLTLTANGLNKNITQINYNECYDQMKSIIENQLGFEGNASGESNYINTEKDVSLGTEILQHSNPILKTMMLNSQPYSSVRSSIEYAKKEYTKFKAKFRNTLNEYVNNGLNGKRLDETQLYDTDNYGHIIYSAGYSIIRIDEIISEIMNSINVGKSGLQPFFNNGVIENETQYYIPATPAYLGLDKVYEPTFTNIILNKEETVALLCHDGSYEKVYGDFRDTILLRLEEKIYNSVNDSWKNSLPKWNNYKYIPGKFRETPYTLEEYNTFVSTFFEEWCNINNASFTEHKDFDTNDLFTYNYSTCSDKNDGEKLHGSYRAIYLYYYDTYEPHIKPWEMLGFGSRPSWWVSHYGKAPYTSDNIPMWIDIENGYIADGDAQGYHEEFKREGLIEKYLPVDNKGNLLNPLEIGIIDKAPIPYFAKSEWEIGDMGEMETIWSFTSDYRYALQIIMYLMRPIEWVENNWNTLDIEVLFKGTPYEQIILKDTLDRPTPSEIVLHNELLTNGEYVQKIGIQQWISDFLTSENINITSYIGNPIRNIDLRLTYRCGRYYMKDSLKVISDNYSVLPSQNYHMYLYKTQTDKQVSYSAMVIIKTERGYMLDGYDLAQPYFNVLTPIKGAKKTAIEVNGKNVFYYNNWSDNIVRVKYKTIFTNIQELYDIICGYGKYLENVEGWVFNKVYEGNNEAIDFTAKGEDFIRFASINPEVGQLIMLNPGYEGLTIQHEGFLDTVGQYINGQWSVLDTLGNPIYNDELDVYRHNGYSEINTKNRLFTMLRLNFVEYEHLIEFDNKTIYGDILYDPSLCVKTQRLKIMGTGINGWDGTLYSPGYLIEEDGAVPNYDKLVEDFKYFYDTDDVRSSGYYGQYAKKTIGYRPLPNMERLLIDERNMFDFYKGLIREKGTRKSFGKLNRSRYIMTNDENQIDLYDNWAFKLGEFGYSSDNFIMEFNIDSSKITQNPQIVTFTTRERNNSTVDSPASIDIYWNDTKENEETGTKEYWLKQLKNKSENTFTFRDYIKIYPTGGFAQIEDVNYVVNDDDMFEQYKEYINVGETVWVVKKQDRDWDIYKRVKDGFISMRVNNLSLMQTMNTDYLENGDLIYVSKVNLQKNIGLFNDFNNVMSDSQNITDKNGWAIFKYITVAYSYDNESNTYNIIGYVKDGTNNVYDFSNDKLIGTYEHFRTAFNLNNNVIGKVDDEGNVFNDNYVEIGKLTVNNLVYDKDGNYFGYVNKDGLVFDINTNEVIGEIKSDGSYDTSLGYVSDYNVAYDNDNNLIGKCDSNNVVYDFTNEIIGEIYENNDFGEYIGKPSQLRIAVNDEDEVIGHITVDDFVYDFNNNIIGKVGKNNTIINNIGNVIGSVSTNKKVALDKNDNIVGYYDENSNVFNIDNTMIGVLINDIIISVEQVGRESYDKKVAYKIDETVLGYCEENRKVYTLNGTFAGISLSDNTIHKIIGSVDTSKYIVYDIEHSDTIIGYVNGTAVNSKAYSWSNNEEFGFVKADGKVYDKTTTTKVVGIIDTGKILAKNNENENYGYANDENIVYDVLNQEQGTVIENNEILGNDQYIIGNVSEIRYIAYDNNNEFIGYVEEDTAYDFNNTIISFVTPNGYLYNIVKYGTVSIDKKVAFNNDDELLGYEFNGYVYDVNGVIKGKERQDKTIDITIGKVSSLYAAYDENNEIMGYIDSDDDVYNFNNEKIGRVIAGGAIIDLNGNVIGMSSTKQIALDLNDEYIGYIDGNNTVYDFDNIEIGKVIDDGSIDTFVGKEAYDKHVLVNNDVVIGYVDENDEGIYDVKSGNTFLGNLDINGDIYPNYLLYRCQNKLPDITKIDTCYIIDNSTDKTLAEVQLYDPLQGIVPNKVLDEVSYISSSDPCLDYDDYYEWGDKKVGELWWDLSKVKYLDYHQGDVNYRRKNWGKQLPGSEIAIMEWTKSSKKPEDGSNYVTKEVYNYETSNLETYYYYWVKNPVEVSEANFRNHSALHISQVINSPQDEGIIWMAPVYIENGAYNTSSFIIGNFDTVTTGSDFVVQMNFMNSKDLDIHHEWALVREGDDDDIPESLWKKMKSSLVGYTEQGYAVPNPELTGRNRLGLSMRPMQSMFADMALARRNMVDVINEIFLTRDVTSETDVGTPRFNYYFSIKSEMPQSDIADTFTSSEAMKAMIDPSNIGKKILIEKDDSYDGIWTYWKMNGVDDFELLDYEKYNIEKYYSYATLYKDFAATTAQPVFTLNSLVELTNCYRNNNIEKDYVIKLNDGSDWTLYRVIDVIPQKIWYNLKNEKMGYVNNGKAYDKSDKEVGILITSENQEEYNTKYEELEASVGDIIIEVYRQDGDDVEQTAVIIGYMVSQNAELETIAKNKATIVLYDDLYTFLNDKDLVTEYEKKIKGEPFKEFIDGQTKYEYLLNETSILVSNILDYFDNEIDFVDESSIENLEISKE